MLFRSFHAFATVLYDCENPEDYVNEYYTIEMYKKAYAPIIYSMPSKEQWIQTNHGHLEPLRSRVAPGRPKRLRRRGVVNGRSKNSFYLGLHLRLQHSDCHGVGALRCNPLGPTRDPYGVGDPNTGPHGLLHPRLP